MKILSIVLVQLLLFSYSGLLLSIHICGKSGNVLTSLQLPGQEEERACCCSDDNHKSSGCCDESEDQCANVDCCMQYYQEIDTDNSYLLSSVIHETSISEQQLPERHHQQLPSKDYISTEFGAPPLWSSFTHSKTILLL